jgi:hypothetical protein
MGKLILNDQKKPDKPMLSAAALLTISNTDI